MTDTSIDEGQAFLSTTASIQHIDVDDSRTLAKSPKCDSYNNLYDQDLPLGGSAHSLRNQLAGGGGSIQQSPRPVRGGRAASPRTARNTPGGLVSKGTLPECSSPPPPYDYSSRSQDKSLSSRYVSPSSSLHKLAPVRVDTVLTSDDRYPDGVQAYVSRGVSSVSPPTGNSTPVVRTIPSNMPRYGSPTFPPTTVREGNQPTTVVPLSLAAAGVQNVPGAVRRPMSFVKALEMSDQLTGAPAGQSGIRHNLPTRSGGLQETVEEDERAFGSSYEIAV